MKKIAVVGTGYVGLVTGTCFAETGNQVTCIDIDEAKVNQMNNSEVPFYEPNLESLFKKNIASGNLKFTHSLNEGVQNAEIVFLALPTPPEEDGSADLSYVLGVAKELGDILTDYKVIVNKSTVPVGTAEKVYLCLKKNSKVEFSVVSNPEFLRQGQAVLDFMNPDRIVVGCSDDRAKTIMEELYQPFVDTGSEIYFMDEKSSELTKYAANSFLATKITFMNEVANFCELIGADVDNVRKAVGSDTRIGHKFLYPGIGFGGSCFPKDIKALLKSCKDSGYQFEILNSVVQINQVQKTMIYPKLLNYFKGDLTGKKIAFWGLSFKPNTDDLREAPSLYMIDKLKAHDIEIVVYDPEAMHKSRSILLIQWSMEKINIQF
jgi:UDPglucose 6-dehydrogenase